MSNQGILGTFWYLLSIVSAMGLKITPLAAPLQPWNPDWVLLLIIYWALALPYKCGVFSAWLVGVFVDVLTGRPLGQYALIYAIISFVCLKFYKRIRHFPVIQQGLLVFCCLLAARMLEIGIESIYAPVQLQWRFLLPVISGTLVWPIAGLVLRNIHLN